MHLAGQAKRTLNGERGYAMAALLVALSIMAIMFTVVMPVWKQTAQREKEEELVFRIKQYGHAISLFRRKFANAYPPNIDVLVEQRFLRKKYKDPITKDDFLPVLAGQGVPATNGPRTTNNAPGGINTPSPGGGGGGPRPSSGAAGQTSGGIVGVTSKSKDPSIRLFNGRGHYNEWVYVEVQQQPGVGQGGSGTATPGSTGQRGQPGQQPGPFAPGGSQPGQGSRGSTGGGAGGGAGAPNFPGRGFGGGAATPVQPPSTPRGRF